MPRVVGALLGKGLGGGVRILIKEGMLGPPKTTIKPPLLGGKKKIQKKQEYSVFASANISEK